MKIRIAKVVPYKQNIPKKSIKGQPFLVNGQSKYFYSSNKLDEKNYAGFPVYIQLMIAFPDQNTQYDYGRFQVIVEYSDYKEIVSKHSQYFKNIKKGQTNRDFVFTFLPLKKGSYRIRLEIYYKIHIQNPNPNQRNQQKKDFQQLQMKFEDPVQITQLLITNDKTNSIVTISQTIYFSQTFPFFIQHGIQNKIIDQEVNFKIDYISSYFHGKFLNDKNQFKLKTNQVFYSMLQLKPIDIKSLFSEERNQIIGQLNVKYGEKGQIKKRIMFNPTAKFIVFKASTLQKIAPKKDIIDITVRFQKIYNLKFGLGEMSIKINQSLMDGIKIINMSKNQINLQNALYEDIIFSVVCLKSGYFCLKGISLVPKDNKTMNFINDINLFVEHQDSSRMQKKSSVFNNKEQNLIIKNLNTQIKTVKQQNESLI